MKMDVAAIQCGNRACRIAEDGKCLEGLAREACPNFGKAPAPAEQSDVEGTETDSWELRSADRLSKSAAVAVLRRSASRVVAILGPHDAGKTSLIAGLYDLFQDGPIGPFHFSNSRTLHAFEMACHDTRAASERSTPHINRTPLGDAEFFHLDIEARPDGERFALLIADRAGEDYRTAANDVRVVDDFFEVRRADTLTFLVDGRRLLDAVLRHQARNEVLRVAQAIVDGGATSPRQRVAVVLTKLDEIKGTPQEGRVIGDFANVVSQLRITFGTKFAAIESFETAALPKSMKASRGFGLSALLDFWLDRVEPHLHVAPRAVRAERVFRRLTVGEGE